MFLVPLSKIYWLLNTWICAWVSRSISLACVSLFMPVLCYYFGYCSVESILKAGIVMPPALFFLPGLVWLFGIFIWFSMNFQSDFFSISVKTVSFSKRWVDALSKLNCVHSVYSGCKYALDICILMYVFLVCGLLIFLMMSFDENF